MKTTYEIKASGDDKRVTLDELRAFVQSLDGASGTSQIRATATVGGWLKSIKVEVER